MREAGRPSRWPVWLALLALTALAIWLGEYDLSTLTSAQGRAQIWERLRALGAAFAHPDLRPEFLARGADLAATTVATATLGFAFAAVLGFLLALATSRNVMVGDARGWSRTLRVCVREGARLLQDVLRGIPDFAWALILVAFVGLGSPAGILALGLNVAGILARVFSEQFDAVPERALEPLRASGASRLQVFAYGVVPAIGADMLSFGLLRWECAMRNASVIGAVGGGGLGADLKDYLNQGEYDKVVTLLGFLLLVTAGSDLLGQFLRARLRHDPEHPRARPAAVADVAVQRRRFLAGCLAVGAMLALSLAWTWRDLQGVVFGGEDGAAWRIFSGLLTPDWSRFGRALESSWAPLSIAWIATGLAVVASVVLSFPGSVTFQLLAGRFAARARGRFLGGLALVVVRLLAIVARGVPEVFWAIWFVSLFKLGTFAALCAIAVHTFGLLLRLFVESVDAVPLHRLEAVQSATQSRAKTYAYAVVPAVAPHWIANSFFQFESNLRASIVLGMVGLPGLGYLFDSALQFFRMEQASMFALVMVAWALLLDRLSRWLGLARARLAG